MHNTLILLTEEESTHFNKHFGTKMAPHGKSLEFFLLDATETKFWIKKFNLQRRTQPEHFFPKSGHFFRFSKKAKVDIPPPL